MTNTPMTNTPTNQPLTSPSEASNPIDTKPSETSSATTATAETLSIRQLFTKNVFWIIMAVFLIGISIFTVMTQPSGDVTPLSIENVQPNGSMAVAEVLRKNGVDVKSVNTFEALAEGLDTNPEAHVVLIDENNRIKHDLLAQLPGMTNHLTVLRPGFQEFDALGFRNDIRLTGLQPKDTQLVTDFCHGKSGDGISDWLMAAFDRAGPITGGGVGYTIMSDDVSGCYSSQDDPEAYSIVWKQVDNSHVLFLGHNELLTNEHIREAGNASVALQLLGQSDVLYWYIPTFSDFVEGAPTIVDLTPVWVTPIMILLLIVVIVAALQSGRRFGPLVAEKLPVTVPAQETVQGRARMYQRSRSYDYLAEQLRMGSVTRLAKLIGLTESDSYSQVIGRLAEITQRSVNELDGVLISTPVSSEIQLTTLAQQLHDFEDHVRIVIGQPPRPSNSKDIG